MSDPVETDLETVIGYGSPSKFDANGTWVAATAGWNPGDATVTESKQVATTENDVGDVTAAKEYDATTETTQPFKAASASAPTLPPFVGNVLNGKLVTKISIKTTATDFATMEITGHAHAVNSHTASADHPHIEIGSQGDLDLALTSGFGAQNFLGATLGTQAIVESADIDIEISHVDHTDGNGDHWQGHNFKGHVTCRQTFCGTPTAVADSSWTVKPSKTTTPRKEDFPQVVVQAEKWIALHI